MNETPETRQIERDKVISDVLLERSKQIAKGYSEEHDDSLPKSDLEMAAACYVFSACGIEPPEVWPVGWDNRQLSEKSKYDMLKCATALLVAAMERLNRQEARNG